MRMAKWVAGAVVLAVLGGCGVPREAGRVAAMEARVVVQVDSMSDAQVRAALEREAAAWGDLREMLRRREFAGIAFVPASFEEQVARTASLARRQVAIQQAGDDDPALNRRVLSELRAMWRVADAMLAP